MQNFIPLHFTTGKIFDLSNDEYPANLYVFDGTQKMHISHANTSFFGFLFEGEIHIKTSLDTFTLKEGMYFEKKSSISGKVLCIGNGEMIRMVWI